MEGKGQEPCLDFGEGEGEDLGAHCEHDDGPAVGVRHMKLVETYLNLRQ